MAETRDLRVNSPVIGGNANTTLLKLIALLFMFLDHSGKMCFPGVDEMRMLGRIAFPVYCWCMVVGASYTRSFPKYLLRIGVIGLVSQPLYMAALNHPWSKFNIFLTLFIALCGLWGLREKRWGSHIWAPVLALAAAELLGADYGWRGVLLIFLLWSVRGSRSGIAAVMISFGLFWGATSYSVTNICGLDLTVLTKSAVGPIITPFLKLQSLAILALPLLLIPMKWKPRLPAWFGYALYPGHLVLLIALEYAMGTRVHWEHLRTAWNMLAGLFS